MSAEDPVLYVNKPYSLTLTGPITVHYLDGQALHGEILAQDALNIFLKVEGVPHLIPRQQIRYITGAPGQLPVEETSPAVSLAAPPEPAPPPVPTPAKPEPQVAHFVEEEEIPFAPAKEDSSGTVVLPMITEEMVTQAGSETSVSIPPLEEPEDMGRTLVFPPTPAAAPSLGETTERTGPPEPGATAVSTNLADLFETTAELDGEATFIIGTKTQSPVSAHLICTSGPHAGEVLQLKPGLTTIGRSSDNSFALSKDKEVSRRHAIIAYEANKFVIQDQNSLNHTFVNNEEIKEPRPLADGDLILIGVSTLKFQEG